MAADIPPPAAPDASNTWAEIFRRRATIQNRNPINNAMRHRRGKRLASTNGKPNGAKLVEPGIAIEHIVAGHYRPGQRGEDGSTRDWSPGSEVDRQTIADANELRRSFCGQSFDGADGYADTPAAVAGVNLGDHT